MKKQGLLLVLLLGLQPFAVQAAVDWERLASHCQAPNPGEETVVGEDFPSSEEGTYEILGERFERLYESGRRLSERFYFDSEKNKILAPVIGGLAEVSPLFIQSVKAHLKSAMEMKYADWPFLSDMGHMHNHIPQAKWDKEYDQIEGTDRVKIYTKLLADPDVKFLYHTAEQLDMVDENRQLIQDRYLLWRYFTRNIMGTNNGRSDLEVVRVEDLNDYNTVASRPGYHLYSAGAYIHGTKEGCFSFEHQGRTYYFDLNFSGYPYENVGLGMASIGALCTESTY